MVPSPTNKHERVWTECYEKASVSSKNDPDDFE